MKSLRFRLALLLVGSILGVTGMIIPPSILLILYGVVTGVSISMSSSGRSRVAS